MAITILQWNIEQFGAKRAMSGRMTNVARVLADNPADVVLLLEVQAPPTYVVNTLAPALVTATGLPYNFVVCPSNGLETYLYLYNPATVQPIVTSAATIAPFTPATLAGLALQPMPAAAGSTTLSTTNALQNYFPLLRYDPAQPQKRPVGVGIFRQLAGASTFAVLAWHNFSPLGKPTKPVEELNKLQAADFITAGSLTVQVSGSATTVNRLIVAADFNVDWNTSAAEYAKFPGYITANQTENTHIISPDADHINQQTIRDFLIDNFVYNGAAGVGSTVVALDDDLMTARTAAEFAAQSPLANNDVYLTEVGDDFCDSYFTEEDGSYGAESDTELATIKGEVNNYLLGRPLRDPRPYFPMTQHYLSGGFDHFLNSLMAVREKRQLQCFKVAQILNKLKSPDWYDVAFLLYQTVSDHLPTTFTF